MNKLPYLSLFAFILILAGCEVKQVPQKPENPLVSYLYKYSEAGYNAPNDIVKEEIFNNREDSLRLLQDSLCIFTNLEGTISRIRLDKYPNSVYLSYDVEMKPKEYFSITLHCSDVIPNDSLDTNPIYQFIHNTSNNSSVYVDGVISVDPKKNKVRGEDFLVYSSTTFPYPDYTFNVADIRDSIYEPRPELLNSISLFRKSFNYLLRDLRHESYNKATFDEMADECNKSLEALTPEEKKYMGRYKQACMNDLAR